MRTYCIKYSDGTEELVQANSEAQAYAKATDSKQIIRITEVE